MKQIIGIVIGVWGGLWLWGKFGAETAVSAVFGSPGSIGPGGAGGSVSGGSGGAGGAGGSVDYSTLASAIAALAAGVAVPNIQSVTVQAAGAGSVEAIAGEGGKRVCVLAYAITAGGAVSVRLRSGGGAADLYRIDLNAPAGNSGANLATAWPGYLTAADAGASLQVVTDAAAVVTLTYWQENV